MTREEALSAIRAELSPAERVLLLQEWDKRAYPNKRFRCCVQWHVGGDPYNPANYALAEGYGASETIAAENCLRALCEKRSVR